MLKRLFSGKGNFRSNCFQALSASANGRSAVSRMCCSKWNVMKFNLLECISNYSGRSQPCDCGMDCQDYRGEKMIAFALFSVLNSARSFPLRYTIYLNNDKPTVSFREAEPV